MSDRALMEINDQHENDEFNHSHSDILNSDVWDSLSMDSLQPVQSILKTEDSPKKEKCVKFDCREIVFREDSRGLTAVMPTKLNKQQVNAVLDTASQICVISTDFYEKMFDKPKLKANHKVLLKGAGKDMDMFGCVLDDVSIKFVDKIYKWSVIVAPIEDDFIIGLDFLNHFGAIIDMSTGTFTIGKEVTNFKLMKTQIGDTYSVSKVWLKQRLAIPSNSSITVKAKSFLKSGMEYVITPTRKQKGLVIPSMVINGQEDVCVNIVNFSDKVVTLKRNHVIGIASECNTVYEPDKATEENNNSNEVELDEMNSYFTRTCKISTEENLELPSHLTDLFQRSTKNLSLEEQMKLKSLLMEYQDIFSKNDTDICCFTKIKHKIANANQTTNATYSTTISRRGEKDSRKHGKNWSHTGIL